MPRFYLPIPFVTGPLILPESIAHHASRVCRLSVGDRLTLFDGQDREAEGQLIQTGKTCIVEIDGIETRCRESSLDITLIQALPAMDRMDLIVQKSVELGVSTVYPITTRRSAVRLSEDRIVRKTQHWQQVAIAACEQSGRTRLPRVLPPCSLDELLNQSYWQENPNRWLLDPTATEKLSEVALAARKPSAVCLIIGCEGGFEPDEMRSMTDRGAKPVWLGPRVLRTETAGPVAIAICQARFGDFR